MKHHLLAGIFSFLLISPAFTQVPTPQQTPSAVIEQVPQQPLAERLRFVLDESPISKRTFIGVQVIDTATSAVLFEQFPNHYFTPASNMKLYSSACALDAWGPEYRFKTAVISEADINDAGVLEGDLVLRGGGDPVLTNAHLRDLVRQLTEERGLKIITGDLVIDDSLFADRLKGPGWMWDDDPDYYNMSVNSLMVDYNVLRVMVTQEGEQIVAALDPQSDYPSIVVREPLKGKITVTRKPFTDVVVVESDGSDAPFAEQKVRITMHDPARWAAGLFARMLNESGIELRGSLRVERQRQAEGHVLAEHESAPMSEILALFNKPSENAIGEMLLLNLAANAGERPATWTKGADVIGAWLTGTAGLAATDFRLVDGSGLSRYNTITPSGTVKLLRHMWAHPHRQVYIDSLPIIGVDGTTSTRGGTLAPNRVFAKTGTMSGVSCLSGYVHTEGDDWLVFSILMNGYLGTSAAPRALQDRLVGEMAKTN